VSACHRNQAFKTQSANSRVASSGQFGDATQTIHREATRFYG